VEIVRKALAFLILLVVGTTISGCCCLSSDGNNDNGGNTYDPGTSHDSTNDDIYSTEQATVMPTDTAQVKPVPTIKATWNPVPSLIDYNNQVVGEPDKSASNNSVKDTAKAMLTNDKSAFLGLISTDVLNRVSGGPDLTSPEAIKLANGLNSARMIEAKPYMMTYQMTIDSTTYTFNTIKEDGTWKLTGL
jgi:hypothetical protein